MSEPVKTTTNPSWQDLLIQLTPLILQYGVPFVQSLVVAFQNPNGPTPEDWQNLITLTQTTARQNMMAALVRAGIDPNSPQGLAMLALTPA